MIFFLCFKQKTAYEMRIRDWSSDVCSSDLARRDVLKNLHAALSTAETLVAKIEAAPAPDVGLGRTAYETVWRSLALELAPASADGGPLFPHLGIYRATVERALDALPARAVSSGSVIAVAVLPDALEAGRDTARNDGERPSGFPFAVTPGSPFERRASACYAAVGGGSPIRDLRRYRKSPPLCG